MLLQLWSVQACLRIPVSSVFGVYSEIKLLDTAVTLFAVFVVVLQWTGSHTPFANSCCFLFVLIIITLWWTQSRFFLFYLFRVCVLNFEIWSHFLAYLFWHSICRPSCCLPLPLECWIKGMHLQTQPGLLYLKGVLFTFVFLNIFACFCVDIELVAQIHNCSCVSFVRNCHICLQTGCTVL